MSGTEPPVCFVDTNILVYAMAAGDQVRSPVAQRLIEHLMSMNAFRTSTQILQELFVTLTRKGPRPLGAAAALRYLDQLAAHPVVTPDYALIRQAAELSDSARLSFWDALVVVSAARARAVKLYTEDLQHGRPILGVEIVNPFRPSAGSGVDSHE
jgi:predicted nucleic acid-binding protein